MKNVLMIGLGSVAKTMLELWNLEKVKIDKIVAIDPVECEDWVKKIYPHLEYKKMALTKSNLVKTIKPLLSDKPFVVDLSVDVDCVPIIKLCKDMGCHYINTSIERWGYDTPWKLDTSRKGLINRSLYKRQVDVAKAVGNSKKSTILTNNGMNPGLVSSTVKQGLKDYALLHGTAEEKEMAKKGLFAKLAKSLGLEEIHISEIDTQIFNKPRPKNHFYSTWSAIGFIAESLDPIQMGWGSNRDPNEGVKPPGEGNIRIFPERGMSVKYKSITLGLKGEKIHINGMLIPHAEADTISSFLTDGDYRPSVFYVYQPSSIAFDSLDDLKKRDYHPPPNENCYVMRNDDIISGYDSVGTLLIFDNGKFHWCGSVLDVKESRRLGFKHAGPTTVQVASSLWSAMKWIARHEKEGYIEPEDLDYNVILKNAKPYLGKFYSKTF
jgi:homospermidine synthase